MKSKIILPLFSVMLSLCSCQHSQTNTIYASFYPVYDFVKRIVQDKMDVVCLTPSGSEPHDYELTAKTVANIYDGKALFLNGLGLESFASSLPKSLMEKTYTITEGITTLSIDNTLDPHVWLNPLHAITEMENILSVMKDIDPINADCYQANFETAKLDFEALDQELTAMAKEISNKYVLVSHAAFGYLCQAYGLTQIAVSGLSPESEPTGKAIQDIIEKVKDYDIKTIFYEENVSSAISEKISQETGIRTDVLNPLEGISKESQEREDYCSIMKENMNRIQRANV